MPKYKYLISTCLTGENCRWDKSTCLNKQLKKLAEEGRAYPVCPEQLGGLSTPRAPSEIIGSDGEDVLGKKAIVRNKHGLDVTGFYIKGAYKTLEICHKYKINKAILKDKSPSCGYGKIYDGSFTNKLKKGNGVTCALLLEKRIEINEVRQPETDY